MKRIVLEKITPDPKLTLLQFVYIGLIMIGIIGVSVLILYLLTQISSFVYSEIILFSIIVFLIDLIFIFPVTRVFQNMNYQNIQKRINISAKNSLKKNGVILDKLEYLNDIHTINKDNTNKQFIALDTSNKIIVLIDYLEATMYLCDYKDIKSYEIVDNVESNSSFTPVLINNKLMPVFRSKSYICKILYLVIYFDTAKNKSLIYSIIDDYFGGVNKQSVRYKKCLITLDRVESLLANTINDRIETN